MTLRHALLAFWLTVGPPGLRSAVSPAPLAIDIAAPGVPAGAVSQIRISLPAPRALSSCQLTVELDPKVWDPATGVFAFSATGDQGGTATVEDGRVRLGLRSDSGGLGSLPGVPIAVIHAPVRSDAAATGLVRITTPASCEDQSGYRYEPTPTTATFRAGGTLAIESVTPGGGLLPAGSTVRIAGRGFTPTTSVQIDGVAVAAVAFVSDRALDVTLAAAADLTGHRVQVFQPQGPVADFFPALTGKFTSNTSVLRIMPQQTGSYAALAPGFALQNPSRRPVNWWVLTNPTNPSLSGSLEPGETYVYAGLQLPRATSIAVQSEAPLRMLRPDWGLPATGQLSLSLDWEGGTPLCAKPDWSGSPTPCWLATAGVERQSRRLAVIWNNPVPFQMALASTAGTRLGVAVSSNRACSRAEIANCTPQITLSVDPSLPPGDYPGMLTVTAEDATVRPVQAAFTLRVTAAPVSLEAPGYLYFSVNESVYSRGPVRIGVTSPIAGTPFSVRVRETTETGWLSVTPLRGVTPAVLDISVNPGPAQLTGIGYVEVIGPANSVSEPVNMVVTQPVMAREYPLEPVPASLAFWARPGSTTPQAQPVSTRSNTFLLDTVTIETGQTGGWLTASTQTAAMTVTVNPKGLGEGVYRGTVKLEAANRDRFTRYLPAAVPVTLVVSQEPPGLTLSPAAMTLTATGGTVTSGELRVSSAFGGVSLAAGAATADGGGWLSLIQTCPDRTSALSGCIQVNASAASLPPGTYSGVVTVTAPPESPHRVAVRVTFVVTPRAEREQPGSPLIARVVNAASLRAGAVAPGETVSLFGLGMDPNLSPRVLFDGVPAELLFTSPTRINAVVPTQVADKRAVDVMVETTGMRYTVGVPVAGAAPALFTADGSGQGQAAAFLADGVATSVVRPVSRGEALRLLLTGSGIAKEKIWVEIGGAGARVESVAPMGPGVSQLTVVVPENAETGPAVPVTVTIGPYASPAGVTLAVR